MPRGGLTVVYATSKNPLSHLPDSEPVEIPGGCGVNRILEFGGRYEEKNSFALCELMDVNGDGLPDMVDYANSTNDIKAKLYNEHQIPLLDTVQNQLRLAFLGTGREFLSANIVMPGPSRGTSVGCDVGPDPTLSHSRSEFVYLDVTGDGIVDYLYPFNSRTAVRVGSAPGRVV